VSRCTLEISAQVVVEAREGPLSAEYALFDPGDIELQSSEPGTNREAGYRTTAGQARARLAEQGVTATLAAEAAEALRPVSASYARGAAVQCIIDRLGAAEFFEGHLLDPGTGLYRGAWLDLPALSADLGLAGGSILMQAIHLAALLAERGDDEPVALQTSELTALRRPGERTYRRVTLDGIHELVPGLRGLGPGSPRPRTSSGPSRQQVVERLRARADRAPASRGILPSLEAALTAREMPTHGPLADPELWSLEVRLSQGETRGIVDELDALERRRGRLPGTAYLRARADLWLHPEKPRELAERVAELSTSMPAFHELELLAAQAWAAAGEVRRARAFARDLLDNGTAPEAIRLQSRLILDDLEGRTSGHPAPLGPAPTANVQLKIPRAPRAPTDVGEDAPIEAVGRVRTRTARPEPGAATIALANRTTDKAPARAATPVPASSPRLGDVERIETLSLPAGLQGIPPPALDEPPRAPPAARLAFTFLTRELGRELRMRHGVDLQTDTEGLELAQRYLREKLTDGRVRTRDDERELMRNGAFLSELLARRLGAFWVDLESTDSARWAMLIPAGEAREGAAVDYPPEPTRVWPFARVLRFVAMGHKERDLVSYYLELEATALRS
jgi:hypothetical protein